MGSVAGVGHHIQKDPPQVLRHHVEFLHFRAVVFLYGEVEVGVGGAGAVVGKPRVFLQQGIDIGRLGIAGSTAHLEHVTHDPVRAQPVMGDPFQVGAQVAADFIDQAPVVLAHPAFAFLENLLKFLHEFRRDFGKVLYEIQRILDFVRHPGRQFSQLRKLFAHDDLVLGPFQVFEDLLQFLVLVAQLLRHALDQVQPLRL